MALFVRLFSRAMARPHKSSGLTGARHCRGGELSEWRCEQLSWMAMRTAVRCSTPSQRDLFATPTMSTSSPSAPLASSIPARKARGIKLWRSKPTSPVPSQPATDWLGPYLVTAKAITAAGEMVPFPYLKGVFGTAVLVLETIQVQS